MQGAWYKDYPYSRGSFFPSPQSLLDLNTVSKKELQSIKGIGHILAERIIDGRPYRTVDDLLKVKGVGPKKLENIRPYFVVDKK